MNTNTAADGFAAMGSTARLDVLRVLVRAGDNGLTVGEIQQRSGIAPSTLAHHLKTLTEAGVTEQSRAGRTTVTRANYDHIRALAAFVLTECCTELPQEEPLDE